MNKLFIRILTVSTIIFAPIFAMAQEGVSKGSKALPLTLEQALEIALSESNTIKIADMTVEKTGYAQKGSYAALYPNVSVSGAYHAPCSNR